MASRENVTAGITGAYPYLDKVNVRTAQRPRQVDLDSLRANSSSSSSRRGHPIRSSLNGYLLTVVAPNQRALELLTSRPDDEINYVEPALDIILSGPQSTHSLRQLFDFNFVQPWHGRHDTVLVSEGRGMDNEPNSAPIEGTTYTGQRRRGIHFAGYSDRASKLTGEVNCVHIEGRIQGKEAVERIGIYQLSDLLTFDHVAFWRRHLSLFDIDFERLGLYHHNKTTGQRLRAGRVKRYDRLTYYIHRRIGGTLFRALSVSKNQQLRTIQRFVDQYGRGPFLKRMDSTISIILGKVENS